MLWRGALLAVAFSACAVELNDVPGRACDEFHLCRAPRVCVSGACVDPSGAGGGGGAVDSGMTGGGGSSDSGTAIDGGQARWQQKLHGFSDSNIESGCALDIDPLRGNRVLVTIQSTLDSEDTAVASMVDVARLPRGLEGRLRGRVTLPSPLALRGQLPFASLGSQTGQAWVRLSFDEQGALRVESDALTLGTTSLSETFRVDGGFPAGDTVFEVAWRAGSSRQVRINGALLADTPVVGGATVPPNELTLGLARYDGTGGVPVSLTLSSWQLADELSVVLTE